jgi:general secretion pathway protein D
VAAIWSGTEAGFRTSRPMLQPPEPAPRPAAVAPSSANPQPAASASDAFELAWKGPAQVKPGEEFTVLVEASSAAPLSAAELQLLFDPTMFSVVRVAEGDWLKTRGAQTVFEDRSNLSAGRIVTVTRRLGVDGASGAGALLAVTLRAIGKEGPTQMFVTSAIPSRAGGGSLPVRGSGPLQIRVAGAGVQ